MIVAGLGMRPGAPTTEIIALISQASESAGRRPSSLAIPHFRKDEPGPHAAAISLSLAVTVVEQDELAAAQPGCQTRSARAEAEKGIASVAEGCALAAAGPGARLILLRIASANVTCAFAENGSP